MKNQTILQYFEWYLPLDAAHWRRTARDAEHLAGLGITDVWLPPAYKCHQGLNDVGYGVYDLYDLGEFFQKGTIPTKYGTKDEYLAAIDALHACGIRVIADIVLNHRIGADDWEATYGHEVSVNDRFHIVEENKKLGVWTVFDFPGRLKKYSKFQWNKNHFTGVDWNQKTGKERVFKIEDHIWDLDVDEENENYDYLMGADVRFALPEVRQELTNWGKWYVDFTKVDGFRLDAVKHIRASFFPQWLRAIEEHTGKEHFTVGEYWSRKRERLTRYLDRCGGCMRLFDVPLQNNFRQAADDYEDYPLDKIFQGSLLEIDPDHAVTFVDNHDTQPTQKLHNWVDTWFKPLAYALILLRDKGVPCVFYGDLYGMDYEDKPVIRELEALIKARELYAYGDQDDHLDHGNTIGWTRQGAGHGGMAVVMTNGTQEGWKDMPLGNPGDVFVDMLGNRSEEVVINDEGIGHFTCNIRSVSVWIPKK